MVLEAEELCPKPISSLLAMILFISNQHKTDSKYMISSCVDRQISLCLSEPQAILVCTGRKVMSPRVIVRMKSNAITCKRVPGNTGDQGC